MLIVLSQIPVAVVKYLNSLVKDSNFFNVWLWNIVASQNKNFAECKAFIVAKENIN